MMSKQAFRPRLAAEWMPHAATLIAWPWRADIWAQYLQQAQQAIRTLVVAIAEWEPVILLVPSREELRPKPQLFADLPVEIVPFTYDDIWLRDTTPLWLDDGRAIDPGFNGWGVKPNPTRPSQQIPHRDDAALARRLCVAWSVERIQTGLVLEGGAVETDGTGLLLSTASNLFHPGRNGASSLGSLTATLTRSIDATLVLLPGHSSVVDITDGHVDGLARLGPGGRLIIEELDPADTDNPEQEAMLTNRDALRERLSRYKPLKVRRPFEPRSPRRFHAYYGQTFSYLNYYVVNGGLVVAGNGCGAERADVAAATVLAEAYGLPCGRVKTINVDGITLYGGGGVHCVTREIPVTLGLAAADLAESLRLHMKRQGATVGEFNG